LCFVEPVLPLSLVLGIMGGGLSTMLTLGRKFEKMDNEIQEHVQILDRRIDKVELVLAKDFVSKQDLMTMLERLDDRIDRMDSKLDRILFSATSPHINYDKNDLSN